MPPPPPARPARRTRITVKVVPKSSRAKVLGFQGDILRLAVTAAPEKGKANQAVIELLAEALGVAESSVQLVAGATSPRKIVEIEGLEEGEARRRLGWPGPLSS